MDTVSSGTVLRASTGAVPTGFGPRLAAAVTPRN